MDWLSNFAGNKGIPVLIFAGFALFAFILCVKKGWISFRGKGFNVGLEENERNVVRKQVQYVETILDGTIRDLPNELIEGHDGYGYYRCKYIIGKIKDVYEDIIHLNHIENNDDYIDIKFEIVYNSILKLTDDEFFKTEQFKNYMRDLNEKLIKRLYKIRHGD